MMIKRELAVGITAFLTCCSTIFAASVATRSTSTSLYTPGAPVTVTIVVTPDPKVLAYAIEETPPSGWTIANIDNSGVVASGIVKWGVFFDGVARTFSYTATPPAGQTGIKGFSGVVSYDGSSLVIGGTTGISDGATVPPSIKQQPTNQTVVMGQSATFSVSVVANPAPTFQWKRNGVVIPGATSVNYVTPATTLADNGAHFSCTITNTAGFATTTDAVLLVNAVAPMLTLQPMNQSVALGQYGSFTVRAQGSTPMTFKWQRNGVDISGATSATYTTPPATSSDDGAIFVCVVTNAVGTATSQNAVLTINANAPIIRTHPASKSIAVGASASFSVQADGPGTLAYQWQRNGYDIPGAVSPTYVTPPVTSLDDGSKYRCVVSNDAGLSVSLEALLSVSGGAISGDVPTGGVQFELFKNIFDPAKGEGADIRYSVTDPSQAAASAGVHSQALYGSTDGSSADLVIGVYDIKGRLIKSLFEGTQAPGDFTVHWDGRNSTGQLVASGTYIVRLKAGSKRLTRKIVVVK